MTDWKPDPWIVLLIITQFSRLEHALAKNDVAGNEIIKVTCKNLKLSESEAKKGSNKSQKTLKIIYASVKCKLLQSVHLYIVRNIRKAG